MKDKKIITNIYTCDDYVYQNNNVNNNSIPHI